jgi:transcriptional accessory protein Tex/SPT6
MQKLDDIMTPYSTKRKDKVPEKIKTGTLVSIYRSLRDRKGHGITKEESVAIFHFEEGCNYQADGKVIKAMDAFEKAEEILIGVGYQIT